MATVVATFLKDPDARLPFGIHLAAASAGLGPSDWLDDGDTVTEVETELTTVAGCTLVGAAQSAGGKLSQFVAGGTVGETAELRFRFTTAAGLIDDRTIAIEIEER